MDERELSTADLAGRSEAPAAESGPAGAAQVQAEGSENRVPLLPSDDAQDFKHRWETIQTAFVDEPRRSVEQADGLVAEMLRRVAETFSSEREALEGQWGRGEVVSTEDLRVILQRYRSFFNRLLSA
jgi:hypothetical protein